MALTRHWKLDDNAASTVIVATVGADGTLEGGDNTSAKATTGPGASITAALDLNGTDDGIQVAAISFASGAEYSLSIWFKLDSSGVGFLWGLSTNATNSSVRVTADTTIIVRQGATNSTFTVPALGTTNWHHCLVTKTTGDSVRLFLDGTESSTGALSNTATMAPNRIGRTSTGFHDGKLAWAKVFNTDESANVATLYAEGVTSGFIDNTRNILNCIGGGVL